MIHPVDHKAYGPTRTVNGSASAGSASSVSITIDLYPAVSYDLSRRGHVLRQFGCHQTRSESSTGRLVASGEAAESDRFLSNLYTKSWVVEPAYAELQYTDLKESTLCGGIQRRPSHNNTGFFDLVQP